jgi:hypothetical protein
MPGIFGFRLRRPGQPAAEIADRFASDCRLYDWQHSEVLTTTDPDVCLGVTWNGHRPEAAGASWFRDDHVTCVLDGYIVRTREEMGAASLLAGARHAEVAVRAYHRHGDDFAAQLEGPFSLVLHDDRDGRLVGVTERHGLSPLYRHDGAGCVCFASMLGPMARSGAFPAAIDPASVSTLLMHKHLFYRQSLVANVVLQDPATIAMATADGPSCSVRRYWHYGQEITRRGRSASRRLDELCDALLAAAGRIVDLPGRHGAGMSGGLDSRLMVGLAHRFGGRPNTWTMGSEDSPDRTVAAEICARLGLENHGVTPSPDRIPEHASHYATMLNGTGLLHQAFNLDRCHDFRDRVDIMQNGYRGGVVLGSIIVDLGIRHRVRWWMGRLGLGSAVVTPNLEEATDFDTMVRYYEAICHHVSPRILNWLAVPETPLMDMFVDAVSGTLADTPPEFRIERWSEEFGGGRVATLCSIFPDRHFFNDVSLFYDYDVRDRCFAIDPAARRGNRAYVQVLERLLPDLASITYANTGLPANQVGLPLLANRVRQRLTGRWITRSAGFRPERWLREPALRTFCGDLVHSERFRTRPWWRGEIIAADFDRAMSGEDALLNQFWTALTLELFVQRWLD